MNVRPFDRLTLRGSLVTVFQTDGNFLKQNGFGGLVGAEFEFNEKNLRGCGV